MDRQHLIFVYGSLRQGQVNHSLLKDAHFHGTGATDQKYAMYLVSGYPYVTSSEPRYQIFGELYAIDDQTLDVLDKTEGHPHYYVRRETAVTVNGESFSAWMYFRDPSGILLPTGNYNDGSPGTSKHR